MSGVKGRQRGTRLAHHLYDPAPQDDLACTTTCTPSGRSVCCRGGAAMDEYAGSAALSWPMPQKGEAVGTLVGPLAGREYPPAWPALKGRLSAVANAHK